MSTINYIEQVEDWMKKIVPGQSFVDVGGLWGTVGERVSMAARYQPASLAMIDAVPFGSELWSLFQQRLREFGIDDKTVKQVRSDVESPDFAKMVGSYDVVYSSGLLYHSPDPMHFMGHLAAIANKYLIFGTIVLSDVMMERLKWKPDFPCSLFVPSLNDKQKMALSDAYQFPETTPAFGITHEEKNWFSRNPTEFGVHHNAAPFWWLHPPEVVETMIDLVDFKILDRFNGWDDRLMFFICERKTETGKRETQAA